MIKRGVVSEKVMDFTSKKQLPPLKTLPQWQRVGSLDKNRYPKQFVKDVKNVDILERGHETEDTLTIDISGLNPGQHIAHLERSIAFIRSQHADVLQCLHIEIEKLKKENKDLNLKIILTKTPTEQRFKEEDSFVGTNQKMYGQSGTDVKAWSERTVSSAISKDGTHNVDDMKMVFLEDEIKQLKHAVREGNARHYYMVQTLDKSEEQRRQMQLLVDTLQHQQQQIAVQNGFTMDQIPCEMRPDGMSDNSHRAPTLVECELIIRHLRKVTEKQSHELDALKSDLRDVLYSHKWTPDAYLLAKAYVAADDAKGSTLLPHIPSRKMPEIAYVHHDNVTLPALKQTLGNKSLERRKRTKILQKARLNKVIPPPQINISP